MILLPGLWWVPAALAFVLLADAALSIRPAAFIRECLNGVRFPHEWWSTLIVIKTLAAAGLIAGIWVPGVGLAANVGVIVYFLCAAGAHLRARFLGPAFWINCLGMLTLAALALVLSFML
ncbi:DoxX family protein [uncultured Aeromicrobium sp.]|uniref:DoxX family protein n=1 Tax=uncultured Aeromicrobium sp. TaxID=337820 RepID=UPI0025D625AE|nr:DoxX family protein [uncultured Aeromicrobium sp.]